MTTTEEILSRPWKYPLPYRAIHQDGTEEYFTAMPYLGFWTWVVYNPETAQTAGQVNTNWAYHNWQNSLQQYDHQTGVITRLQAIPQQSRPIPGERATALQP